MKVLVDCHQPAGLLVVVVRAGQAWAFVWVAVAEVWVLEQLVLEFHNLT